MKFLKCIICGGEIEIIFSDYAVNKKVKCRKCGFTNHNKQEKKEVEVIVIKKR